MEKHYLTFLDAAERLLLDSPTKTMHYAKLTNRAIELGLIEGPSETRKTPERTMYSLFLRSIARASARDEEPKFTKLGNGVFGLNQEKQFIEKNSSEKIQDIRYQHNTQVKDELLQRIYKLDWRDFESLIGFYFYTMGYENIKVTRPTKDGGFDVSANFKFGINEMKVVIEVKKFAPNNKIGVDFIHKLRSVVNLEKALQGIFITTSDFKRGVSELASSDNPFIQLISGKKLVVQFLENNIGVLFDKEDGLYYIDDDFFESKDYIIDEFNENQ